MNWQRFARNRLGLSGAVIVVLLTLVALLAPWLTPFDPIKQLDYGALLKAPGVGHHLLGTDELGRDELSRVILGARISLSAGLISVGIAVLVGIPIGLLSGYFRGFWDEVVVMRITDTMQAFPFLILALVMAAVLGPGFVNAMVAIGIGFIPGFVRLVRGQVIVETSRDYIEAAHALGARPWRVMMVHILPNIMAPVLVQASLAMSSAIIAEAGLSYLGLGVQPPMPSWGSMLRVAQGYPQAPWMAIFPGAAIFVAVFAFNVLGDGLRDYFDPKLRR